jgi:hypothetical protein
MVLHRSVAWRRAGIILPLPHTLSDVSMANLLCTGKVRPKYARIAIAPIESPPNVKNISKTPG